MFRFRLSHRCWGRAMLGAAMVLGVTIAAGAAESSVPYVPTPQEVVERMLEMARVGPHDYLIDLGSGDGRIVVTAAKKRGARGFGVDLNPVRIKESIENAAKAGVSDRVAFHQRDLFETDLSDATVITMYLLPKVNLDLRPKLLELKPGTRLVSHDFSMDDWKPDAYVDMDVKEKYGSAPGTSSIYFWIVPARVAGAWQWQLTVGGRPQAYELALDQKFQMISGTVRVGGQSVKLENARLSGDQISFSFSAAIGGSPFKHEFSGRVAGSGIGGTVRLAGSRTQGQLEWNATRSVKTSQSGALFPTLTSLQY